MRLGNVVGPRALCRAESNFWDNPYIDKKSWACGRSLGEHAMPSPTFSPPRPPFANT